MRAFALAQECSTATIVLDARSRTPLDDRVARRVGFSTARPLDVRAGAGDDQISYNVNAPGLARRRHRLRQGRRARHRVRRPHRHHRRGRSSAPASTSATPASEIVEVDGLEGDDEFFVQSTAFGVAYRVIGGLGSDTINVTGDVTEDIVVKRLEGLHGHIDHIVSSADPRYDGLVVDGIDVNVATPTSGNVIITETGGFTTVREGDDGLRIDRYDIRLATAPTGPVYVTVSAGRSPQQEAGRGDTIWLCTGATDADCDDPADFQRYVYVNSDTLTGVAQRSRGAHVQRRQLERQPARLRAARSTTSAPEGTRVVAVSHSVISTDARFDGTLVRNVEVSVRDDDTPGVTVQPVQPGTSVEDDRTVVIEGNATTALLDELLVRLAAAPAFGTVSVRLMLDAESDQAISISSADTPLRRRRPARSSSPPPTGTTRCGWSSRRATTRCARTRARP